MTRFTVEALPKHPSLEMQQKLAKRLLRDAWRGNAQAIERIQALLPGKADPESLKLHDAQLVVARGYGFDSWAAMKLKIEALTRTPLEQFDIAVRAGDAERARQLLAQHLEVRSRVNEPRFDFDSPAIHQAKKHLPLVDVLLEYGADINARSTFWAGSFGILEWNLTIEEARPLLERGARLTPWAAAEFGLIEELRALVREAPDAIRERGGDGKTLLHFAATIETIAFLVDCGADLEVRDVDHASTPLQHHIDNEELARYLILRGAKADVFAAARLGDAGLVERCLRDDPLCPQARVNSPTFTGPGGHIYGWTLGFDLTPIDVARKFGHLHIVELLLSRATPKGRFLHALWWGDEAPVRAELGAHAELMDQLDGDERRLLASAAWWHRPETVRLMLDVGFDPHVTGAHRSTPLDRASFHGYADIVATLLKRDPQPPLTEPNEFGIPPLHTCIYGSMNGWDTGHPRDHALTLQFLLEAGAPLDPTIVPTGNDDLDVVLRAHLRSASIGEPSVSVAGRAVDLRTLGE